VLQCSAGERAPIVGDCGSNWWRTHISTCQFSVRKAETGQRVEMKPSQGQAGRLSTITRILKFRCTNIEHWLHNDVLLSMSPSSIDDTWRKKRQIIEWSRFVPVRLACDAHYIPLPHIHTLKCNARRRMTVEIIEGACPSLSSKSPVHAPIVLFPMSS
jgi:hypothetical protein